MTCLFAKVYVFLCFFYISRCCSHYIHYISNWITIVILFCRWPINCHKGMGGLTVSHQCQDQLAKNQPGWTFMNFSVRLVVRRVGENGNANSIQNWNFFWRNLNRSVSSESPCPTKACIFRFQVRFFGEYIYIYMWYIYSLCLNQRMWRLPTVVTNASLFWHAWKGFGKQPWKACEKPARIGYLAPDAFASRPLIPPVRAPHVYEINFVVNSLWNRISMAHSSLCTKQLSLSPFMETVSIAKFYHCCRTLPYGSK